jgi:hypothetical protein
MAINLSKQLALKKVQAANAASAISNKLLTIKRNKVQKAC